MDSRMALHEILLPGNRYLDIFVYMYVSKKKENENQARKFHWVVLILLSALDFNSFQKSKKRLHILSVYCNTNVCVPVQFRWLANKRKIIVRAEMLPFCKLNIFFLCLWYIWCKSKYFIYSMIVNKANNLLFLHEIHTRTQHTIR